MKETHHMFISVTFGLTCLHQFIFWFKLHLKVLINPTPCLSPFAGHACLTAEDCRPYKKHGGIIALILDKMVGERPEQLLEARDLFPAAVFFGCLNSAAAAELKRLFVLG